MLDPFIIRCVPKSLTNEYVTIINIFIPLLYTFIIFTIKGVDHFGLNKIINSFKQLTDTYSEVISFENQPHSANAWPQTSLISNE